METISIDRIGQLFRFYWRTEKKLYLRLFFMFWAIFLVKVAVIDFLFMHINRDRLLQIVMRQLHRMACRRANNDLRYRWCDIVDFDFMKWLSKEIILLDPTVGCKIIGRREDWNNLSHDKSLFHSPDGCGLPIGNLTSQLFSNVYLNELDQYMKRELGCKHYGRYVDDFYVVGNDREWLHKLIPQVRNFLTEKLSLQLHDGKVGIYDVRYGVEYLGAYLKPYRRYISNSTLCRMMKKMMTLVSETDVERLCNRVNSFLGVLGHYSTWRLQQHFFGSEHFWR